MRRQEGCLGTPLEATPSQPPGKVAKAARTSNALGYFILFYFTKWRQKLVSRVVSCLPSHDVTAGPTQGGASRAPGIGLVCPPPTGLRQPHSPRMCPTRTSALGPSGPCVVVGSSESPDCKRCCGFCTSPLGWRFPRPFGLPAHLGGCGAPKQQQHQLPRSREPPREPLPPRKLSPPSPGQVSH